MNSPSNEPKMWYRSRTFWVGALTITVGVSGFLSGFLGKPVLNGPASAACLVNGVSMVMLRWVTDSPIRLK